MGEKHCRQVLSSSLGSGEDAPSCNIELALPQAQYDQKQSLAVTEAMCL